MTNNNKDDQVKWADIDKVRFYGIGTAMYTAITLGLHPITVMKTRQQVLSTSTTSTTTTAAAHITTGTATTTSRANSIQFIQAQYSKNLMEKMRIYYRGIGIILLMAIPARGIYIGVLENSKEIISSMLQATIMQSSSSSSTSSSSFTSNNKNNYESQTPLLPLITSISGGLAGGLAAMSSQSMTVPMDVISQRQMVMNETTFQTKGSAFQIIRQIIETDGISGFYRGLGMSFFTSLPTGCLWWGTYSGCQQFLQRFEFFQIKEEEVMMIDNHSSMRQMEMTKVEEVLKRGLKQGICGISAAIVAATLTQPLDVIRTRLQVGNYGQQSPSSTSTGVGTTTNKRQLNNTYSAVAKELYKTSGIRGFFRGTTPRVASFCLWGTVLSSAYEYLRHISHKDYEFFPKQ